MKKFFYAVVLGSAIIFFAVSGYSQERGMQRPPRPEEERPGMPQSGGAMGGMMSHGGMGMMSHEGMPMKRHAAMGMMMRRNPHLAGIMMQMRGEMMRIRGEAMMKQGDVLRRYGERLEKDSAAKETGR